MDGCASREMDVCFAQLFSTVVCPPLFHSSPPIQSRLKVRGPPQLPHLFQFIPQFSQLPQLHCAILVLASVNALEYQWPVPMPELSAPPFLASSTIQPAHVFGGGIYCFMPNAQHALPLANALSSVFHFPPYSFSYIPIPCPVRSTPLRVAGYSRAPFKTPLSTAQPPSQTKRIRFGSPSNQPARTSTSRHTPTNRCLSSSQKQREPETPTSHWATDIRHRRSD